MDETMSSNDESAAVAGTDVEEVLKSVSREEDEVMKDVDYKVSDAGDDVVMDVDLVRDETDSCREVGDLPSRVSDEENQGKQPDGQVSGIRDDVRDEDTEGEGVDHSVSRYDSLLTKFASGGGSGSSTAKTFGFQAGDMVWGKVKSHPWWPGNIFKEAFASPSVRRTRREGHMLVAFFGDSSYGWFDPTELVPFNDNFAEKSKQTSAKSFIKAVDEAVDEVCRRRSLGITCRCRNPENFRPADEEGYFAIDLVDYDYVAVYPQPLIDRVRDRFTPLETIRFISQLAKRPLNCDHKSLDLSENKAVVMQLRKAMFEEFDDTYSEAFGYQPNRPIRAPKNLGDDSLRVQAQAQLSGPLVIAETLHGKKNSKSVKVKDQSKKNKYVLKRRDESYGSNELQFRDRQFKSSAPLSYVEGESALASGDYVLQRRSPATSTKINLLPVENMESLDITTLKASLKKENDTPSEMKASCPLHEATNNNSFQPKVEEATDLKLNENAQVAEHEEDVDRTQKNSRTVEESHIMQPVDHVLHPRTNDVGSHKKMVMKKPKTPKRSIGEIDSGVANQEGKKKKIKKETLEGHPGKKVPIRKAGPMSSLDDGKEKERTLTFLHGAVVNQPLDASANPDLKFRDVLFDLKVFALDPFHGAERNSLVVAKQMFLKFRSLVFQKSLLLAPIGDSDSANAETRKSATIRTIPDTVKNVNTKDKPINKPSRPLGRRPDDPTKGGRKRPLSDRQEEMATKKSKKISDIKSLANEKKAGRKVPEPGRKEKETSIIGQPPKVSKFVPPPRRVQLPPRVPEPTMLALKFPQGTAMPTAVALKAQFSRFGPLDLDSLKILWQSSTCRVVFRYKADAQKAYEFAVSNTSLFGIGNIRCQLREVEVQKPETKEEAKEEAYPELPRYDPPLPPSSQLKSILKKSSGDGTGAPSRASVIVKFVLDGKESGRGEPGPVMASRNFVNDSAVGFIYNIKTMDKVLPETTTIELLPDDILLLILAFLSLKEAARTSILSQRWRNLWHHSTCLNFDDILILPRNQFFMIHKHDWYVKWVNSVIGARAAFSGLPLVKEFRIQNELVASDAYHIDQWIQFAIVNRVETLQLQFGYCLNIVELKDQYVLTEDPWLKAPSGLSSLQCLKSLVLTCVNVSRQFFDFILLSCPLLEDLWLENVKGFIGLDFSVAPHLRLRQLTIYTFGVSVLANLSAPRLTSLYYNSNGFNPQKIDVPMLSDLIIGDQSGSQRIMPFLIPLSSYLPQLEKLELLMVKPQEFSWKEMPQLAKLKYLKIIVKWDTDPISYQIRELINACPLLETFALQVFGYNIRSSQSIERRLEQERLHSADKSFSFKSLKVLELYGRDGKTLIDQVVAKCIIKNASNLEKVVVDIRFPGGPCKKLYQERSELNKAVKAKAEKLCQNSRSKVEVMVIG